MKNALNILMILLIISFSNINAQWSFGIITEQQYNNNPFQSPLPTETLISSYDFNISNTINDFEFSYYGSYLIFNKIPERNFYWHQVALQKSDSNYSYGILAEQRIGKDIYTYFDFKNLSFFYSNNFQIENNNINISPVFSYNSYDEIKILDNIKLSLNYKFWRGFESGTSFFIGGSLNYKKYIYPTQSGFYTYLDQNNILQKEYYVDKNINSLFNLTSYIRIAQSIAEYTGMAFQYTNRTIMNKIADSNKELNVIYGDESEIFDDPTNIQGNFYALELTQIIDEDWQLKLGYYFYKKYYPTQGVYDKLSNYFVNKMRIDNQNIFGLSLSKSFEISNETFLNLTLNFQTINNNSNSFWFNYKNTFSGINLGFQF
ncbi:MAG: hypothetical protein N2321_11870 [Melioribacteraceae bacterium]|nr:hypothetical protein [Melioribacteraceae bacterium]